MKTFNNYSQPDFSIHNKAERYSWAAYHLFVLLSSLIGDTLILFASLQKDAFKLNRFIVTAIQYIAVFDLAYAMTGVLPTIISLIANTWVLGAAICYLRVYLTYFIYLSGMSLYSSTHYRQMADLEVAFIHKMDQEDGSPSLLPRRGSAPRPSVTGAGS